VNCQAINFILIYACTYEGGEIILDLSEHEEYRWASKEELLALDTIHFAESWLGQTGEYA